MAARRVDGVSPVPSVFGLAKRPKPHARAASTSARDTSCTVCSLLALLGVVLGRRGNQNASEAKKLYPSLYPPLARGLDLSPRDLYRSDIGASALTR